MAGLFSSLKEGVKRWIDSLARENTRTFGTSGNLDCCNLPGKQPGSSSVARKRRLPTEEAAVPAGEYDTYLQAYQSITTGGSRMATTIRLTIEGMTCDHCVMSVKSALVKQEGVKDAKVRIGSAEVEVEGQVDPQALVKAVEEAGYTAKIAS
ncbi:Heavy metal transport/detoxification protein [Spirochaeta thermophila DSM 6578]|uniref:Heavy metal transport/detoxification protein n=1 Tax=Winmispira thermophila (strain ATCC 700085 / DSM 6578 / Z-1203) TaxID=869211 RepID=G0GAN6_WINT7|nr:cation transporter [Spirochaeta thermophila]AEJ61001.1 Heavy metal transport/detoxification protein [Spirochaeta thermophila DSM 6578]